MNRMGIIVLFTVNFLCLLAGSAFAVSWAKVYDYAANGIDARDIQPTPDGGFIVFGSIGGWDVYLMKLTSTGNVSWQKSYGGAGAEHPTAVQPTNDGGYIFVAATDSYGAGDWDGWVVKLTSTGAIQWQQSYGGIGYDEITTIQQTTNGGFIFAGFTESFGDAGYGDAWVAKINSSGATVWQKAFGSSNTSEQIDHIQVISGDKIICAGRRETDAWVMRLSPLGNISWQKSYGDGASNSHIAYRVQRASDGGFVVAGYTNSLSAGGFDFWVFKLNSSGTILWQKTYGGPAHDFLFGMDLTSDGGSIVTGWTESFGVMFSAWVLKLDSAGGITWQKTYGGGGSDVGMAILQTSDGNYTLAGQTTSFGVTGYNVWVLKLESNGDIGSSCSIINASSATAVNSTAVTTILTATSVSIPVKVNITSAVPVNVSTSILPLC